MNDFDFGNYIYERRCKAGMTQAEMAERLGVTNKAVSKWETGKAKPTTNTLRKMAALFGLSVDELLQIREGVRQMEITKIVITGGPCAGKTTAMSWIQSNFTKLGYTVLFVPETATELITGGVAPWTCGSNVEYQKCQMKLQLEKEKIFEQGAVSMPVNKVLIVCDRGALDNKAYMTDLDFSCVLDALGCNEVELRDNYDAVFHLVTAAKGAEQFYTTANNTARTETVEQAAALDDKLIAAWTGHPHLRIIDNATDFEDKLKRLIAEISSFLGEPEPYEIERKFLIEFPDVSALERLPNCQRVEIIQTYLAATNGEESRVRQRGLDGNYIYFQTTKKKITELKRVEVERRLSKDEYLRLLMDADPACRPIRKTRYCLTFDNQYFEIDIYPFWKDKAILEIELADESAEIRFPAQIKVIGEVTDDDSYKNASLARIKE
jgi:CYTH domain-containing protein/DNA-binding XRE family transcriptional regulator